tara:strand:- start:438 stop:647 length:210 start_codon:yes stop_codon:yes gene_type:complete
MSGLKGYLVAHKEWLVVIRQKINTRSKGVIRKQFNTKQEALDYLGWMRTCGNPKTQNDYQSWVIPKEDW